eukprot:tig00000492_g1531.t1
MAAPAGPMGILQLAVYYAVVVPLTVLYFHGPTLFFWGGLPLPDICARMTDVPASFWERHTDACRGLCLRRLTAFVLAAAVAWYWAAALAVALALTRAMDVVTGTFGMNNLLRRLDAPLQAALVAFVGSFLLIHTLRPRPMFLCDGRGRPCSFGCGDGETCIPVWMAPLALALAAYRMAI